MDELDDVRRLWNSRWLLVVVYVAVIFTLSAQPGLKVPGDFILKDKVAHALEYCGLSILMYGAVRRSWPRASPGRRVLLTLLAIAVLAMTDELFQYLIPDRDSSPLDWMADMVGASLGQIVCAAHERMRRRR